MHRWRTLTWILLAGGVLVGLPVTARSQTVVEIYQRQWYRKQALQFIQQVGPSANIRPPQRLATAADSLLSRSVPDPDVESAPMQPPLVIRRVQRIPKLARGYFTSLFEDKSWSFLGANRISVLDTMMTREIRARLEAQFGKPTRTLVDDDALEKARTGEVFQFEYWFVLNDSIPLVVTDVNGPFERGVATSTSESYGNILLQLRNALLSRVSASPEKAPFVDYYYDDEIAQWYRTGYDGADFFLDPVERPGLSRPVLTVEPE